MRSWTDRAIPIRESAYVFDNGGVGGDDAAGEGLLRGGVVEELVFGTADLREIDQQLRGFCASELRSPISEVLFHETSVGVVFGVLVADGRRVVVKVHQPRETFARLQAVHEIQRTLFRAGLPCPEPLSGPVPLGHGHATVEALLDKGEFRDTHDPTCRRLIAGALADHLEITSAHPVPDALVGGWSLSAGDGLWPAHAHSPIFDFDATRVGAEWIDEVAAQAKALIAVTPHRVAGHSDWSGKHFRFADREITAIYDWDSLAVRSEAALVGIAAMTYSTSFDLPEIPRFPTPDEMHAFVDEYSGARGAPLTIGERQQIAAHGLYLAAYTARCEHCGLGGYDADTDPASFTTALRTYGTGYLQA